VGACGRAGPGGTVPEGGGTVPTIGVVTAEPARDMSIPSPQAVHRFVPAEAEVSPVRRVFVVYCNQPEQRSCDGELEQDLGRGRHWLWQGQRRHYDRDTHHR
jgi:hypothetical protein